MLCLHQQSLLSALFSTLLLIVSFVFSVLALTSPNWASTTVYSGDSIDHRTPHGTPRRGPFRSTVVTQDSSTGAYNIADGSGTCFGIDESYLCQQLNVGAGLLITTSTLAGVALVLLTGLCGALAGTRGQHQHHRLHHDGEEGRIESRMKLAHRLWALAARTWIRALIDAVMYLEVVCGVLGTAITAWVLVNEQRPDGDFISSVGDTVDTDHWMLGKGVAFGLMAWLPTVVASAVLPVAFRLADGLKIAKAG